MRRDHRQLPLWLPTPQHCPLGVAEAQTGCELNVARAQGHNNRVGGQLLGFDRNIDGWLGAERPFRAVKSDAEPRIAVGAESPVRRRAPRYGFWRVGWHNAASEVPSWA